MGYTVRLCFYAAEWDITGKISSLFGTQVQHKSLDQCLVVFSIWYFMRDEIFVFCFPYFLVADFFSHFPKCSTGQKLKKKGGRR